MTQTPEPTIESDHGALAEDGASGGRSVHRSEGVEQTEELGERLAAELGPSGCLLLIGGLGAGKTALTRGVARALGVDWAIVQSPTYTLVHEYDGRDGRIVMHHLDLYRLDEESVWQLGLEELLEGETFKVVEWADRLDWVPAGACLVRLQPAGGEARRIICLETPTAADLVAEE